MLICQNLGQRKTLKPVKDAKAGLTKVRVVKIGVNVLADTVIKSNVTTPEFRNTGSVK